ncbi:MAG: phospho-N-acetylmuramoyl-pentapeptide-transferase [Spirochaetia bacterium]|nr:phospho-N-acetylmuramoyl-pentapeptide-transferase [Spirochaetia bacterium]MCF7941053.1 phospho-N-acetylmuramoyl-pentapeptide-transferase [Spirochaetia bacterium]
METSLTQSVMIRAVSAGFTAFILSIVLGHIFISLQRRYRIGQTIREDGPQTHLVKAGTPTIGGVFFILSITIAMMLFVEEPSIRYTSALAMIGFGLIGLWDDLLKLKQSDSKGLSAGYKIALQVIMSYALLYTIDHYFVLSGRIYIPWLAHEYMDLGSWYYPAAVVYIVGMANACNLSDGLDGLATGLGVIAIAAILVLSALSALGALHMMSGAFILDGRSDLLVFLMAMIGGLLGFFWYNARPAQVFMGDTGSMAIGGVLSYIAIITGNELLMLIIGAVFVMEAVSVIIQVSSYKLRHKRVFKMAPIHHHFEKIGWDESKVVQRFWIMGIVCAMLGIVLAMRLN